MFSVLQLRQEQNLLVKLDAQCPLAPPGTELCPTWMAGVVDVVYINVVTSYVGHERMGELAKGGTFVSRPETRVDGYSRHEQRS
jgi:hypothetical protein